MKSLIFLIFVFSINSVFGQEIKNISACDEIQVTTVTINVPLKTGNGKSDGKFEDALPVKLGIEKFQTNNPGWNISEVSVISSSANTPIEKPKSITENEIKRVNSLNKASNQQLAELRKGFVEKILLEFKLADVRITSSSEVLGPPYNYNKDPRFHDGNLRLVVPEGTLDYEQRVNRVFEDNKKDYAKVGIVDIKQLLDKSIYKSLWDVKFQPFQGYYVKVSAFKKDNCSGVRSEDKKSTKQ